MKSDNFVRDHLPSPDLLPEFRSVPDKKYRGQLNVTEVLIDRWIACGAADRPAILSPAETWTYADLLSAVEGYARTLTEQLGVAPGTRVLLRGWNSPTLAALHLAVWRVGGVVVSTMPLLRTVELSYIITKAKVSHAICERALLDELNMCRSSCPSLRTVVTYSRSDQEALSDYIDISDIASSVRSGSTICATSAGDPCLIAFTSGTTGEPKGAVHTHKDLLAVCDTFSNHIVRPTANDVFVGSPPLAFTYGLGGLLLFPLHAGASTVLLPDNKPTDLLKAIAYYRASVCFSAPTAYRAMMTEAKDADLSSLRMAVSAGETLPLATYTAFLRQTGIRIVDGIGSTELLHIFISAAEDDIRPGATGRVIPGYEAAVLDDDWNELPDGTIGWLAVKGPTGCRYLDDKRQSCYVRKGWNVTGDAYLRDSDGYFWFQSRMDDMIVSSGYKIAAPEVEAALLSHEAVADCAVVGRYDHVRSQLVKAFVVLRPGSKPSGTMCRHLQYYVKSKIAPYKYPREIEFVTSLPKTLTGKIKRFELRYPEAT